MTLFLEMESDLKSNSKCFWSILKLKSNHWNVPGEIETFRFWDKYDYEYEIFSILSIACALTGIILVGKHDCGHHSIMSFNKNVVVTETSYKVLEVLSFCSWEMVVSKTKHSKTKTKARSTQISKTKHPKLENEAPKTRKRSTQNSKTKTPRSKTKHPRSKTKHSKLENEDP